MAVVLVIQGSVTPRTCEAPPVDKEALQRLAEDRQRVARANAVTNSGYGRGLLGMISSASAAKDNAKLAFDQQAYDEQQKHDLLVYEACLRAQGGQQ